MPDDDPGDLGVDQLGRGDLTGKGTVGRGVAVLGGDLDGRADLLGSLEEVQGGRCDDDLCKANSDVSRRTQVVVSACGGPLHALTIMAREGLTGLAVQLGLVHPLDQVRHALDRTVHLEVASDEELPVFVDHLENSDCFVCLELCWRGGWK